jgi:hypothetical protein
MEERVKNLLLRWRASHPKCAPGDSSKATDYTCGLCQDTERILRGEEQTLKERVKDLVSHAAQAVEIFEEDQLERYAQELHEQGKRSIWGNPTRHLLERTEDDKYW